MSFFFYYKKLLAYNFLDIGFSVKDYTDHAVIICLNLIRKPIYWV